MDGTPNPSSEPGFRTHVETFARAIAALVVTIYGIGFVVLTVSEARYGIFQFSPLRARILLVGFAFTALAALPAAAEHYNIAYYGPLESVLHNADPTLERYRSVVLGSGFVYTAYIMAALFKLVLFAPATGVHRWWHPAAFAGGFLALLVVYAIVGKKFAAHPKSTTAAALVTDGVFLAGIGVADEALRNLTLWFLLSGVMALSMRRSANRLRFALDFLNWFSIIMAVSFYIGAIFGSLPPKFGGGAPTAAVLYLDKPVAWLDSTTASVSLLDETDQGFYVLTPGKSKALFVPRSAVASVYFGPAEDVMKSK